MLCTETSLVHVAHDEVDISQEGFLLHMNVNTDLISAFILQSSYCSHLIGKEIKTQKSYLMFLRSGND